MDDRRRFINDTNANAYTDPLVRTSSNQPTVQLPNSAPRPVVRPHFNNDDIKTPTQAHSPLDEQDPAAKTKHHSKFISKIKSLGHFLFSGKHKFITIPIAIIILAETILLILSLAGAFTNKPAESDSITTTVNDEATSLYNQVTNANSDQDTLDYWNSQFATYEARKDYLEAYNLRIKASDFYLNREDKNTAFTILRATKIDHSISIAKRYDLYSIIATLATDLGETEVAAAYQKVAFQLSENNISNGLTNDVESEINTEVKPNENDNPEESETPEDDQGEDTSGDCIGDECEGYEE